VHLAGPRCHFCYNARVPWLALALAVVVVFLELRLMKLRAALAKLQRAAQAGLLTAGFAHEMKNSMTVLLGFAELSRTSAEKTHAEPRVLNHLQELEKETRRSVARLQAFLRYTAGEAAQRQPIELNELVADALQLVRPMARMKNLLVEYEPGEPQRVNVDSFAIQQVLLNLLLNALHFARSRITVRTQAGDVFVSDDGPGVPAGDREKIFRPFVTTREGGSGLGLSTSREIARSHDGTLELSDASTFVLRLPHA
jgi:signal transduction histidine kinase